MSNQKPNQNVQQSRTSNDEEDAGENVDENTTETEATPPNDTPEETSNSTPLEAANTEDASAALNDQEDISSTEAHERKTSESKHDNKDRKFSTSTSEEPKILESSSDADKNNDADSEPKISTSGDNEDRKISTSPERQKSKISTSSDKQERKASSGSNKVEVGRKISTGIYGKNKIDDQRKISSGSTKGEGQKKVSSISNKVEDERKFSSGSSKVEDERKLSSVSSKIEDYERKISSGSNKLDDRKISSGSNKSVDQRKISSGSDQLEDPRKLSSGSNKLEDERKLSSGSNKSNDERKIFSGSNKIEGDRKLSSGSNISGERKISAGSNAEETERKISSGSNRIETEGKISSGSDNETERRISSGSDAEKDERKFSFESDTEEGERKNSSGNNSQNGDRKISSVSDTQNDGRKISSGSDTQNERKISSGSDVQKHERKISSDEKKASLTLKEPPYHFPHERLSLSNPMVMDQVTNQLNTVFEAAEERLVNNVPNIELLAPHSFLEAGPLELPTPGERNSDGYLNAKLITPLPSVDGGIESELATELEDNKELPTKIKQSDEPVQDKSKPASPPETCVPPPKSECLDEIFNVGAIIDYLVEAPCNNVCDNPRNLDKSPETQNESNLFDVLANEQPEELNGPSFHAGSDTLPVMGWKAVKHAFGFGEMLSTGKNTPLSPSASTVEMNESAKAVVEIPPADEIDYETQDLMKSMNLKEYNAADTMKFSNILPPEADDGSGETKTEIPDCEPIILLQQLPCTEVRDCLYLPPIDLEPINLAPLELPPIEIPSIHLSPLVGAKHGQTTSDVDGNGATTTTTTKATRDNNDFNLDPINLEPLGLSPIKFAKLNVNDSKTEL